MRARARRYADPAASTGRRSAAADRRSALDVAAPRSASRRRGRRARASRRASRRSTQADAASTDPTALAYAPDGRMFVAEKARPRARRRAPTGSLAARAGDRHQRPRRHLRATAGCSGIAVDAASRPTASSTCSTPTTTTRLNPAAAKTVAADAHPRRPHDSTVETRRRRRRCCSAAIGAGAVPARPRTPSTASRRRRLALDRHRARRRPTARCGSARATARATTASTRPRCARYDEQSLAGKILHVDRNGRGLPGHPFCPGETRPRPRSARSSTRRASATRSASSCGRAAGRSSATSAGTTLRGARPRRAGRQLRLAVLRGRGPHARTTRSSSECQAQYATNPPRRRPPDYAYAHGYDGGGAIVAGPRYTGTRYPAGYRGAWFFGDYVAGLDQGATTRRRRGRRRRARSRPPGFDGVDLETHAGGRPRLRELRRRERQQRQRRGGSSTATRRRRAGSARDARRSGAVAARPCSFSADESIDPDGDAVTYAWDFEATAEPTPTGRTGHARLRERPGSHTATLTVRDARGLASRRHGRGRRRRARRRSAAIEAPADGSRFRHGDAAAAARLGHRRRRRRARRATRCAGASCCTTATHIHLVGPDLAGRRADASPRAGDHDADSYYEIELTATDSAGDLRHRRRSRSGPRRSRSRSRARRPACRSSYSGRELPRPGDADLRDRLPDVGVGARRRSRATASSTASTAGRTAARASTRSSSPRRTATLTARYAPPPRPAPRPGRARRPAARTETPHRERHGCASTARAGARATLSGRVSGVATAPRVLVALRTAARQGAAATGRRAAAGSAAVPALRDGNVWMRAAVTAAGASALALARAAARRRCGRGRYVVTTRVTDVRLATAQLRFNIR